jgi:hypothetical protein
MTAIQIARRLSFLPFLPLCWLSLLTGCQGPGERGFTHQLWSERSFREFNAPASRPNVQLFEHRLRSDVLVCYNEVGEDGIVQDRAFFLNKNLKRLEAGLKPRFVNKRAAVGLNPVPMIASRSGGPVLRGDLYATFAPDSRQVTLHVTGEESQTFVLPVYQNSSGTVQKALLTPLAVTGDVVVVGAYAVGIAAVAWLRAGGPGLHCR